VKCSPSFASQVICVPRHLRPPSFASPVICIPRHLRPPSFASHCTPLERDCGIAPARYVTHLFRLLKRKMFIALKHSNTVAPLGAKCSPSFASHVICVRRHLRPQCAPLERNCGIAPARYKYLDTSEQRLRRGTTKLEFYLAIRIIRSRYGGVAQVVRAWDS
jgi:hypothetical protein